jgi:phenylalanyl-tRNA synthetase beta subunit
LYNERRQKDSIKLFEISDVYISESDNITKKKILSIIATGRVGLNYKDFSKKIDIDYIANIFNKALPDTNLNFRCLPRSKINTKKKDEIIYMEINLDEINKDELKYTFTAKDLNSFAKYRPISEQPSSIKDISFSVKDEDKLKLLETLMFNFNSEILKNVFIFDYFKNTKKSIIKIGYRFTFQSHKKTLTDKEIDIEIGKIIKLIDDIDGIKIPGLS